MGHFAEIAPDGTVLRVIVAEQDFIDSGAVGDPANWIETDLDGTIRPHPAVVGCKYRPDKDDFEPPKPSFPSWVLDEDTLDWKPPVARPSQPGEYFWHEPSRTWKKLTGNERPHLILNP